MQIFSYVHILYCKKLFTFYCDRKWSWLIFLRASDHVIVSDRGSHSEKVIVSDRGSQKKWSVNALIFFMGIQDGGYCNFFEKKSTNPVKPMNCIKKQHPLSLAVVSNGQQDSSSMSAVFLNKNKHLVHFFGISHKKTKNSHCHPSGSTFKHFDSNF